MLTKISRFGYIKTKAALQGFRRVAKLFSVFQTGIFSMRYIRIKKNFVIRNINNVHPFLMGRLAEINYRKHGRIFQFP